MPGDVGLFIKRNMRGQQEREPTQDGFEGFFRRASQALGLRTQAELAGRLGLHRSAVTQAKKKNAVPKAWVLAVSRQARVDPDWLESGRTAGRLGGDDKASPYMPVPKVRARLSAGGGSFETGGEVEDYYSFRRDWLRRKGRPEQMVLMRLEKKTPCATTARCQDCGSPERICNVWTITEKSFPRKRISVVCINQDLGL